MLLSKPPPRMMRGLGRVAEASGVRKMYMGIWPKGAGTSMNCPGIGRFALAILKHSRHDEKADWLRESFHLACRKNSETQK